MAFSLTGTDIRSVPAWSQGIEGSHLVFMPVPATGFSLNPYR